VFRERGKLSQAEGAFIRARDGWLALECKALAIEAVAGLAGTQALSLVEEVVDYLANYALEGVDEPIRIYLTCYYILEGCGDDRADIMLRRSHDRLMSDAEK
jgi:hypothetical protein